MQVQITIHDFFMRSRSCVGAPRALVLREIDDAERKLIRNTVIIGSPRGGGVKSA
jgi:hypothetical protein